MSGPRKSVTSTVPACRPWGPGRVPERESAHVVRAYSRPGSAILAQAADGVIHEGIIHELLHRDRLSDRALAHEVALHLLEIVLVDVAIGVDADQGHGRH